jgi:hypothetical protein
VNDELEHFLESVDKQAYLAAFKATATSARWSEIKGAVEIAKASRCRRFKSSLGISLNILRLEF